jgi:hypothetical protein
MLLECRRLAMLQVLQDHNLLPGSRQLVLGLVPPLHLQDTLEFISR